MQGINKKSGGNIASGGAVGEVATVNRYEGTSGAARQQNLNRPQLVWNESSTDPQFAPEQNIHAHGKQGMGDANVRVRFALHSRGRT